MPSISPEARFLGVDYQKLWNEIRCPWLRMFQWPVFAWLTPSPIVRLLQADGGTSFWLADTKPFRGTAPKSTHFTAVELPEEFVLRRSLSMPVMAANEVASAVALQIASASPFAADDLVWGYREHLLRSGVYRVEVALASRKQVDQHLVQQVTRLAAATSPELWICAGETLPIVLAGYGGGKRAAHVKRWRLMALGLLGCLFILTAAIVATPTAQLRIQAVNAVLSYDALRERTGPLVRQRELLLQSGEQLNALAEVVVGRADALRVLSALTDILPDDTALQGFKLQGTKVAITGLTGNSSALMQLLGSQSGLRDVRAPSAATRISGATKEAFAIEFSVDPKVFGAPVVPGSTAAQDGNAPTMAAVSTSLPAPVSPSLSAPAPAPAPAPATATATATATAPATSPSPASPGPSFGVTRPASPAKPSR